MSPVSDGYRNAIEIELKEKEISCRPSATSRREASGRALLGLEHLRLQLVAFKELVELGAIALRKLCSLGHAAARDAQYSNQIFALEGAARVLERCELGRLLLQSLLHQ